MRRLMVMASLLVLLSMACTWSVQTFPPTEEIPAQPPLEPPGSTSAPATDVPASGQVLEGPDINYNGIRFTLDPTLGSSVYVYEDAISIDGATAHNFRFALTPEEYCQTWCLMVYPVAEFEQAFGIFVFPPSGYRGGAAIIFEAQKKMLSMQNGGGDRSLEMFGQNNYPVNNELLMYAFRGYNADKLYGIYVQVPIHAASLPTVVPTFVAGDAGPVLEYNRQAAESMNALAPTDFTPNLDLLDALVASIHVETP